MYIFTHKQPPQHSPHHITQHHHISHSYGTFLKRGADAVVAAVDARVARWVQIPEAHGEDMQV